jgi:hypothetical protein
MDFRSGAVNSGSGIRPQLFIGALSSPGIIIILCWYCTKVAFLGASVAYVRSLVQTRTGFFYKTRADTVAFVAGSAHGITNDEFVTGVCLFTTKSVYTKVIRTIEATTIPSVQYPVETNFLGDGCGILTEKFRDVLEGNTLV